MHFVIILKFVNCFDLDMAKSHEQKLKAVAEAEKKKDAEIEVSVLIRKDCTITRLL